MRTVHSSMTVTVTDAQQAYPIHRAHLARVAQRAVRQLRVRTPGRLVITCLDGRRMRGINRRFLHHDRSTDVISFRYESPADLSRARQRQQIVGEVFIDPAWASRYAKRHRLSYTEELSRYVLHGLLHWVGFGDATTTERHRMRAREDQLLLSRRYGAV